jgi:hypothetical protein
MNTGGDDQHAAAVVRRYAEEVESLLNKSDKERQFLDIILQALRVSFQCEYHVLASRREDAAARRCEVIDTSLEDESQRQVLDDRLPSLFEQTIATADQTWGQDVTSAAPRIA